MNQTFDVEEGNKLIAEFLTGYKLKERSEKYYKKVSPIPIEQMSKEELKLFNSYPIDKYNSIGYTVNKNSLKFHSSWDWLMPVVEKIDQILPDDSFVEIIYNKCLIYNYKAGVTFEGSDDSRMKATYKAVVEFIKWYNTQNNE